MFLWLSHLGKDWEDQLGADIKSLWESGKLKADSLICPFFLSMHLYVLENP